MSDENEEGDDDEEKKRKCEKTVLAMSFVAKQSNAHSKKEKRKKRKGSSNALSNQFKNRLNSGSAWQSLLDRRRGRLCTPIRQETVAKIGN